MKLIFLYGPPAVGKLTIAKELQTELGYKLFHNHMLINVLGEIFGYDKPERRKLVREFRLRILEEAARDNIDMIITIGNAGSAIFDYFDQLIDAVEANGGKIYFVHLTADRETLLKRVNNSSRKRHGKHLIKERLEETLLKFPDIFDKYSKREHLTIDTRKLSPQEAAEIIIKHYKLI